MQAPRLLVREAEILAHAGIFSHAQKACATTKSAPAAPLHAHPAPAAKPAFPALPAELASAFSRKLTRAVTPLVLPTATHLMLALPWGWRLWGAFLSPSNNRCRQQNHKT
jgi:hypothetical protein